MLSSKRTMVSLMVLPALLTLGACRGEQQEAIEEEVGEVTYELQVTNPMPHAMTIFADDGTGEVQLGVVEPMQTITFTITSPASTAVKVRAQDADITHEVFGEVTLTSAMASSWTIEQ